MGYLHRDMKPENICIGQGKRSNLIHLIDFGLVKRFICPSTGQHLKPCKNKGVIGTTRFLSRNAHLGNQQSRADDLIAFGTILVFLYNDGALPWDTEPIPVLEVDDKDPLVYEKTIEYQ